MFNSLQNPVEPKLIVYFTKNDEYIDINFICPFCNGHQDDDKSPITEDYTDSNLAFYCGLDCVGYGLLCLDINGDLDKMHNNQDLICPEKICSEKIEQIQIDHNKFYESSDHVTHAYKVSFVKLNYVIGEQTFFTNDILSCKTIKDLENMYMNEDTYKDLENDYKEVMAKNIEHIRRYFPTLEISLCKKFKLGFDHSISEKYYNEIDCTCELLWYSSRCTGCNKLAYAFITGD